MSETGTVVPPSYDTWWDLTATTNAVLAQLRLTEVDVDANRIRELVPTAGQAINAYLDRPTAVVPTPIAALQDALEHVTIDLYTRARAGQGNPEDFSVAAITAQLSSGDPLGNVRRQLLPHKRRWGVG